MQRIAEKAVDYFNDNECGRKILEENVISKICHINYYNPIIDKYGEERWRYNPVIGDGSCCYQSVDTYRMPERFVEGDYIPICCHAIAGNIDYLQKYDTNESIVSRCFYILEANYVRTVQTCIFHTLLCSGMDRDIISDNMHNKFTVGLIEIMKQESIQNGCKMTHVLVSPEAYESIGRCDELSDVKIISMDEFGVNQEYQEYLTDTLKTDLPSGCTEFVIGIYNDKNGAMFVQPTTAEIKLDHIRFTDKKGVGRLGVSYGGLDNRCEMGFVCEQNKVLLGCF